MLHKYVKTRSVINPYQFPSASIDVAYRAIKAQYQPALSTSPLPPPLPPSLNPGERDFHAEGTTSDPHPTNCTWGFVHSGWMGEGGG